MPKDEWADRHMWDDIADDYIAEQMYKEFENKLRMEEAMREWYLSEQMLMNGDDDEYDEECPF